MIPIGNQEGFKAELSSWGRVDTLFETHKSSEFTAQKNDNHGIDWDDNARPTCLVVSVPGVM